MMNDDGKRNDDDCESDYDGIRNDDDDDDEGGGSPSQSPRFLPLVESSLASNEERPDRHH